MDSASANCRVCSDWNSGSGYLAAVTSGTATTHHRLTNCRPTAAVMIQVPGNALADQRLHIVRPSRACAIGSNAPDHPHPKQAPREMRGLDRVIGVVSPGAPSQVEKPMPTGCQHYGEGHGIISTALTALAGDPFTIFELMARYTNVLFFASGSR